jgi:Lysine methyltransferase
LGAQHVTLTDLPEVVPLLQANVDRNMETVRHASSRENDYNCTDDAILSCQPCDWYKPPRDLLAKQKDGTAPFDVILVADCVWMEHLVAPLLAMLKRLTDKNASASSDDDENDKEGTVDCGAQEAATPTLTQTTGELVFDQFANQSISHLDFAKPPKQEESPVNSWVDIYKSHYKSSGSSMSYSRDMNDEISYSNLHEPPPPANNTVIAGTAASNKLKTTTAPAPLRRNDRTVSSSSFPEQDNDLPDDSTVPTAHCYYNEQPQPEPTLLRDDSPHVIISYQRRGKATHDAFKKGLHELFSHVQVLNPPNISGDKPDDVFYILSCQR